MYITVETDMTFVILYLVISPWVHGESEVEYMVDFTTFAVHLYEEIYMYCTICIPSGH